MDAIELYNPTAAPINLGGWYLSDDSDNYQKFRIPNGTTIAAGGYLVFDEDAFQPHAADAGIRDFSFNAAHGDDVWLLQADPTTGKLLNFIDHVELRRRRQRRVLRPLAQRHRRSVPDGRAARWAPPTAARASARW